MTYRYFNYAIFLIALSFGTLVGCVQNEQPMINFNRARTDAIAKLRQAADNPDAVTRANAIEAMSRTLGAKVGDIYKRALQDPYPAVRFTAVMAIGDIKYAPGKLILLEMAQDKGKSAKAEPDKRVYCAVIYALNQLGYESYTTDLGQLLFDDEKEVRASAAMVMGKLGNPSGSLPLKKRLQLEQEPSVELQLVEALAILGDQRSIDLLESYTKMQFLDDRLVAVSAMEKIPSTRTQQVLKSLVAETKYPRVRVAACGALAKMGITSTPYYDLCVRGVKAPEQMLLNAVKKRREISDIEVSSLQRLAGISLGLMDNPKAINVLHPLLGSQDGSVRVAAAMSIIRLTENYVYLKPIFKPFKVPKPVIEQKEKETRESIRKPVPELYSAGGED